jgi:hypothetical protein
MRLAKSDKKFEIDLDIRDKVQKKNIVLLEKKKAREESK